MANNLRINPLAVQVQDQFDVRVDQLFSQRDAMFARYTYGRADITYPDTPVIKNGVINPLAFAQGSSIAGSLTLNHAPSLQATVQETHQFAANLSNQLALGYTRFYLRVTPLDEGLNIASQLGLQGRQIPAPTRERWPRSPSPASLVMTQSSIPEIVPQNTWQLSDTAFYTHGSMCCDSASASYRIDSASSSWPIPPARWILAEPTRQAHRAAGAGFADFLLGLPDSAGKSSLPQGTPYERYSEYGAFVQDQWHATARLAVSLGLRYDLFTPVSERHNRQSDFLFNSGTLDAGWPKRRLGEHPRAAKA